MKAKIRVIGKDQNRTALGIINAYMKLYPNATLADLQKAFPSSLNPVGSANEIVVPIAEASKHPDDFFLKPDELINLSNGQKLAVKYLWTHDHYEAIAKHALQFGIEAKKTEETAPFEKGSYRLEMLDQPAPSCSINDEDIIVVEENIPVVDEIDIIEIEPQRPVTHHAAAQKAEPQKHTSNHTASGLKAPIAQPPMKKKNHNWLWWLLAALLLVLLLLFFWKRCEDKKVVETPFVSTITETITETNPAISLYDQKIASASIDVSGDLVYDKSGKLIGIEINNETISYDELSTEAEIYNFLQSDLKESGWIVLDKVHFKFNKVDFSAAALTQIKHITAILKKWAPNAKIEIEGFADHIGTNAENQKISNERAQQTANHFIADGFPKANITSAVGLRDTERLCAADDTPACRALNRRAELRITK